MMKTIQRLLVVAASIVTLAATCFGQPADPIEAVCVLSQDLTSYSATIRMTQYQDGNESEIEFTFNFVPPNQMRILYTAPTTVVGQTMILNADKFYTYIPSLHRSVWQDVGDGGGNQGKEMGFLYDFVTCSAGEKCEESDVSVGEECETYLLEDTDESLEVSVLSLSIDEERQIVLLNNVDAAPVAISIYNSDDLTVKIEVLGYEINGATDEAWFAIPEK